MSATVYISDSKVFASIIGKDDSITNKDLEDIPFPIFSVNQNDYLYGKYAINKITSNDNNRVIVSNFMFLSELTDNSKGIFKKQNGMSMSSCDISFVMSKLKFGNSYYLEDAIKRFLQHIYLNTCRNPTHFTVCIPYYYMDKPIKSSIENALKGYNISIIDNLSSYYHYIVRMKPDDKPKPISFLVFDNITYFVKGRAENNTIYLDKPVLCSSHFISVISLIRNELIGCLEEKIKEFKLDNDKYVKLTRQLTALITKALLKYQPDRSVNYKFQIFDVFGKDGYTIGDSIIQKCIDHYIKEFVMITIERLREQPDFEKDCKIYIVGDFSHMIKDEWVKSILPDYKVEDVETESAKKFVYGASLALRQNDDSQSFSDSRTTTLSYTSI